MSRIGNKPVVIPADTHVHVQDNLVTVKGKLGELKLSVHPRLKVIHEENKLIVKRQSEEKLDRSLHGLTRTLLNNLIIGVNEGFEKRLEIQGVGYRAAVSGKKLTLNIGFSHPIDMIAPEGITFDIDKQNKNVIIVRGFDKQLVGQTAAEIRGQKKPEPYKGKGIRYLGEVVARKAGKTAVKAK